jgi:hypothetical protein
MRRRPANRRRPFTPAPPPAGNVYNQAVTEPAAATDAPDATSTLGAALSEPASGGEAPGDTWGGAGGGIALLPGGFEYRGRRHDLTGRPFAMLQALLQSRHHCLTAEQLRVQMALDDAIVNNPEQVIRDTARKLRQALRQAIQEAGLTCPDPLPSTGRGADLTYRLDLP